MAHSTHLSSLTLLQIEALLLLSVCIGNLEYFAKPGNYMSCDTTNSSIVRKFVEKNWSKLLRRYGVTLPVDCPLHSQRDMFRDREKVKQARSSHWQCGRCGKKFYHEHYLDLHLERKHSDITNLKDDSVCLGDYCDVIRCSVIRNNSILTDESRSTDISLWVPTTETPVHKRNTPHNPLETQGGDNFGAHRNPLPSSSDRSNAALADCDEELFAKLKKKCEDLVWECMSGLINVLDMKDFKMAKSDLESGVCSFLSCDRYADVSSPLQLSGPLRPFLLVFGSLLISLCLAVAYYLAWIFSQGPEDFRIRELDYEHLHTSHKDHTQLYNPNLVNRTTRI